LYSEPGQEIAARNFYRPRSQQVAKKYASQFPNISLFTVDKLFGGWTKAHADHFADGGTFDQLYATRAVSR
jgi:sulfate transport system substrate-binding protein